MPFPWGGSLTYSQLAAKFGWPCVVVSLILTPFLLLWSKLLAFPVWMVGPLKNGPLYVIRYAISYPDNERVFMDTIYEGATPTSSWWLPKGWTSLTDYEGGLFYESFWGLLQCLDMDVNDERMLVSSNFFSWCVVSNVFIEYPKAPIHEHLVRFYFPIKGLNLINPFNWVTSAWAVSGVVWFEKVSNKGFAKKNGIHPHLRFFPKAEDPKKIHADKSMTFESFATESKVGGYGSIS
uniref:Uncharacterized protein n=1 Tax=Chaetoceros debilis TaxID=122233 RepID=A0A7S3V4G6_9STRA|mmetsp:Transcript_6280/g.9021  ORF Transcript_6280/g.9021 Transcript_6280/m.9021 type:complete len:236 (+) Transcript_6280:74-781(+)